MSSAGGNRIHVLDMHCDTLDRLGMHGDPSYPDIMVHDEGIPDERMASLADNDADISLDRVAQMAWCQCLAVFVPDPLTGDDAWSFYRKVETYFRSQVQQHTDRMTQIRDARDIDDVLDAGKFAAMLTVENGSFLDGRLDRVSQIADDGVKMLTLTWNGPNALASGHDTEGGLTLFGKEAIRALERNGIVVDVSHLNDRGFDEFVDVSSRPFAASHSNSRSVCGHRRNLDDARFRAIADSRGIVGLNFCRDFITDDGGDPTTGDLLRHVDRFLELGGADCIALGSDFDGCDLPSWLNGADKVAYLHEILADGFGEYMADKICFQNARDFFVRNEMM